MDDATIEEMKQQCASSHPFTETRSQAASIAENFLAAAMATDCNGGTAQNCRVDDRAALPLQEFATVSADSDVHSVSGKAVGFWPTANCQTETQTPTLTEWCLPPVQQFSGQSRVQLALQQNERLRNLLSKLQQQNYQ